MHDQYKSNFIKAGALAKEVRAYGKELIKPGASYNQVITAIHKKIKDLGAIAAFPPQIAMNEVAAHFLPDPEEDIVFSDQLVKLDVGVCYEGAIGDCAVTVDLSGQHQGLIDAAEAALLAAEKLIKVGVPIRELGKAIEAAITSRGFQPIRNLSGHGLGYYKIHTSPSFPNYDDRSTALIKPGMTFAIEPFATNGVGAIDEKGKAQIFSLMRTGPARSDLAKQLITKIKTLKGLPFAMNDLIDDQLTIKDIKKGMNELLNYNLVAGYAPLIEQANGFVAQAENSFLVDKQGNVFVTTK